MPENTFIPLYQQIKNDIKSAIEHGKYKPKEQIPTEPELSAEYSVSRVTVRRAVEELCGEGYLVKQQGSGHLRQHAPHSPEIFRQQPGNEFHQNLSGIRHDRGSQSAGTENRPCTRG